MSDRSDQLVGNIVIIGGGTAGWMTAAALSHKLFGTNSTITLIESAEIGTVGVGEATLPHIRYFNQMLGIDESEFMRSTRATFKLGIEFCDWGKIGDRYMHPFGSFGETIGPADFHHYWIKHVTNKQSFDFDRYCYPIVAAQNNKFTLPPDNPESALLNFSYAFQFDATLYGEFLARYAQAKGVRRLEGKVVSAESDSENGFISSVKLESGENISGELFVDCSGFRGVLIEQKLKTGYEDWSQHLPCNRAVVVPCKIADAVGPFTRATARTGGWQWRIPLQHRIGNGYVYCDNYVSDEQAVEQLLSTLEGEPLSDPKQLFFKTGKRKKFWNKNCIAIGLSAGFLEPLESTSIDLIQSGITNLLDLFPEKNCDSVDVDEYNRLMDLEFERIRDFLMLHYVANQRDDAEFWNDLRHKEWPDSLKHKIDAFRFRGLVPQFVNGLFLQDSWLSVFIGQNIFPETYDPRVDLMEPDAIDQALSRIKMSIAANVDQTTQHLQFINAYSADFAGSGTKAT